MVTNRVTVPLDADARVAPDSSTGRTENPRRERVRETFVLPAATLSTTDGGPAPDPRHRTLGPGAV